MKLTPLARRLAAGAAASLIGAAGAVALTVTPASAHTTEVTGAAECDVTTGEWVVTFAVTNSEDDLAGTFTENTSLTAATAEGEAEAPALAMIAPEQELPVGEPLTEQLRLPGNTEITSLTLAVEVTWPRDTPVIRDAETMVNLEGTCASDVAFNGFVTCDLLIFYIRNVSEEAETAGMAFTTNQDVVHGHAPDFIDPIENAESDTITFDPALDINEVGTLAADESFGPIEVAMDEAHAHGFRGAEGLELTVVVTRAGEQVAELTVNWDEEIQAAVDGGVLDCDGEGGGDDGDDDETLPVTGLSTGLIAGGAALLLALGAGLFMLARRRRVTFTS